MRNIATAMLLRQLLGLGAGRDPAGASDAELIHGFVTRADEGAFEILLQRHGPMVLHVCRRALPNLQDAEDAFQATFLVLARKAGSLRRPEAVGNWLYGVAYRVARSARAAAGRRSAHEGRTAPARAADPVAEITLREAQQVLDAELNRLPEKYRAPLVLCCLEGMARDEAARQLGWRLGTLKSRLERGRQLLRLRLTRRGVALPAALSTVLLGESVAPAGVPAVLARSTLRAAVDGPGQTAAGSLPHSQAALALSEEMIRALAATRLQAGAALLLAVGVLAVSAGLLARRMAVPQPPGPERAFVAEKPAPPDGPDEKPTRADLFGDPLPREAVARFGTVRLRHAGFCNSVCFTPDGRTPVSQGGDGVRTWDVATGRQLRHFMPPNVPSLGAFDSPVGRGPFLSADGRRLALSGPSGITVWDIATAQEVRTVGDDSFGAGRLSPDGRVLAAIGPTSTNRLQLWDVATGRELRRLTVKGSIVSFIFTPGGKTLITVQKDGDENESERTLVFWDVATGAEQRQLSAGRSPLSKWTVSPDGSLLAAVGWMGRGSEGWRVSLWDTANGRQLPSFTVTPSDSLPGPRNWFEALAFTPDNKTLYAGSIDATLIGFDPRTGKEVRRIGERLVGANALAFAPDGKTRAAAFGGTIHLIDMETGRERFADVGHTLGAAQAAITADGRTVITADARLMVLWDAQTGRELHRIPGPEDCHTVFQLAANGRTLVTCELSHRTGKVQAVRLWDVATGKPLHAIAFDPESAQITGLLPAISPDGQTLALHAHDGEVVLLDASTGRELRTLPGNGAQRLGATFSPDGRTLLTTHRDDAIQFWNVADGRKERTFSIPKDSDIRRGQGSPGGAGARRGYSAQFSLDGQILAVTNLRRTAIELYHLRTGRLLRKVDVLPGAVHHFALSPDGRTLAWDGLPEGSIRPVEVATGRERH
jgi:RNA polymerase sigma factor (sigma-70 family)